MAIDLVKLIDAGLRRHEGDCSRSGTSPAIDAMLMIRPGPLPAHHCGDRLADQVQSRQVDAHDAVPFLPRELIDGHAVASVFTPALLTRMSMRPYSRTMRGDGLDLRFVGHVHGHRRAPTARRPPPVPPRHGSRPCRTPAPVSSQSVGNRLADPASRTGDQRHLSRQIYLHDRPSERSWWLVSCPTGSDRVRLSDHWSAVNDSSRHSSRAAVAGTVMSPLRANMLVLDQRQRPYGSTTAS